MAYRRRPRTKVYDCNYNIGESYYRPVMDSLDRKYSGRPLETVTPAENREGSRLLGFGDRESEGRASRLLADIESNGIESSFKPSRASYVAEDDAEIDAEFEATMKKIKAARAARNADLEEEFRGLSTKKTSLADQLLDSVGLNSRTQRALEDEVIYKQKQSSRKLFDDEEDKSMTQWTAVRPGSRALQQVEEAFEEAGAVSRARQSRARLQDIDAEMEDMAARGAARQKRITDLRALVADSDIEPSSSVRVSKRISVKATAEKKQVTF